MSTNRCRSSSLENRLIFQAMDCWECVESVSGGPNIASDGYHQRSTASWAIARWAGVPCASVCRISKPCRWWNDSSLQTRIIARAYGPYEHRHRGTWLTIAAPSTSQPMAPTSAQPRVG
jgi:hypothetical protein